MKSRPQYSATSRLPSFVSVAYHQRAMISRAWHGITPASKAEAYLNFLRRVAVPHYGQTPGNRGVYILRRIEGDRAHFLLISLWESYDAIRAFAGPEMEKAVYYPEDKDFLLEFEPTVTHYEVCVQPQLAEAQP